MLSLAEKGTVNAFMAQQRKIIEAAPPKRRTQGATVIARKTPPKTLEPYVLQVTIYHIPQPDGNDVVFKHKGDCPTDIDSDDLEQYIADYFLGDEDEDYCEADADEFEE